LRILFVFVTCKILNNYSDGRGHVKVVAISDVRVTYCGRYGVN